MPSAAFTGGYVPGAEETVFEGYRETAEGTVREAVSEAKRLQPAVPCGGEAVQGQPADVLIKRAAGAILGVVGNPKIHTKPFQRE